MLRASAVAERIGIPSVAILGSAFVKQGAVVSKGLGLPLAIAAYPGAPMVDTEDVLRSKVEQHLIPAIINGLTTETVPVSAPEQREPEPGSIVFKGSLADVQEHFHRELWSDGLPVIPPTRESVDAFLEFTDRDPDEVIRVLPQEGREASILSIAVNGVMAGCRPEYMPLLVAIVEAIADPYYRIEDGGATPGWEPLVIVSGPIAKELDFNYGQGVMRVGRQANTSVGCFVRLYMRNICGQRIPPGAGDKGTIGYTFNVALAEDEDWVRDIGWPTFAQDMGFKAGENVVTMQSAVAISPPTYSSGNTALPHLQTFVEVMGRTFYYWSYAGIKRGYWHPLIMIGPSIAKAIASEWSKDQVRRYFWENTTVPASTMQRFCRETNAMKLDFEELVEQGALPRDYIASDDPDRPLRMIVEPDHIGLVVAGDPGRNQSRGYMGNHAHGARTSKRIELPREWERLRGRQRALST